MAKPWVLELDNGPVEYEEEEGGSTRERKMGERGQRDRRGTREGRGRMMSTKNPGSMGQEGQEGKEGGEKREEEEGGKGHLRRVAVEYVQDGGDVPPRRSTLIFLTLSKNVCTCCFI